MSIEKMSKLLEMSSFVICVFYIYLSLMLKRWW